MSWQALGESGGTAVWHTFTTNPIFDYQAAFDIQSPKFYEMLRISMFFMIPELEPPLFQRIAMASSINKVMKSFKIAGLLCFLFQCIIAIIAIFILSDNHNLNPDNLVGYIVNRYTHAGFKGLIAVGIMEMILAQIL